jgi:glycosyltransferase involved in cell wall biosynthesis
MRISVIICTHNPRESYLRRTLAALEAQTLSKDQWELLVIDNASESPVVGGFELSWHPRSAHIREHEIGLTPARLRGISEAVADLLLFVDDDNVLAPDYLSTLLEIHQRMPEMAVIGSGSIVGEFEIEPPPWMESFLPMLALREISADIWSNDPLRLGFYPCGAGLGLTRHLAHVYRDMLEKDQRRRFLDRRGSSLMSGGDDDICFTAGSLGMGVGMFKSLSLRHLIPKERLNVEYLSKLAEGMYLSGLVLSYLWGNQIVLPERTLRWKLGCWRMKRRLSSQQRLIADAKIRAEFRARQIIETLKASSAFSNQIT